MCWRTELLNKFKRHAGAILGVLHAGTAVVPRTLHRARAERIAAGAAEREMTLAQAQALIEGRGFTCVTSVGDAVDAVRAIVAQADEGKQA